MYDRVKNIVRLIVGIGLIVGAVFGIQDYALDPSLTKLVQFVAMLILWFLPRPK